MDKLKMHTVDLTDKNIERIAELFPNVITETRDENGTLKKAVDFDLLKQLLSKELVEADDERYRLNWAHLRMGSSRSSGSAGSMASSLRFYDYKLNVAPERNTDWHIGGKHKLVAQLVCVYLNGHNAPLKYPPQTLSLPIFL